MALTWQHVLRCHAVRLQLGVLEHTLRVHGGEAGERRDDERRDDANRRIGVVVEMALLPISHLSEDDADHEQHERDELDRF